MLIKIAEYIEQNVIRSDIYESSPSPSRPPRNDGMPSLPDYDPGVVDVDLNSGGFHSVVQVSARHSLRMFKEHVPGTCVRKSLLASSFEEYIHSQATPFEDAYLNHFHAGATESNMVELRLSLKPVRITYVDPARVVVDFYGDLELYDKNVEMDLQGIEREHERLPSGIDEIEAETGGFEHTNFLVSGMTYETNYTLLHHLGYLDATLRCNYCSDVNRECKKVDVYADITTASVEFNLTGGDTERLFEDQLSAHWTGTNELTRRSRVNLIPTISPLGINPSNEPATEFSDFDVQVFHVGRNSVQAITVAMDVTPGSHGNIADVEHFIGNSDFGVISDDCLMDRLFRYKWRIGGFMRYSKTSTPIVIERKGDEHDATVEGELKLESLSGAGIILNPDTEEDTMFLEGMGSFSFDRVVLDDGSILTDEDIKDVDFGSAVEFGWQLLTTYRELRLDEHLSPEMSAFLETAHNDAYRYLSRPFADGRGDAPISYSRIEGVPGKVFFLGDFPNLF